MGLWRKHLRQRLACAGSLNATDNIRCLHGEHCRTRAQARQAVHEFIRHYNAERRRPSMRNLHPVGLERYWQLQTQAPGTQPGALSRVDHRRSVPVRRKRPNRPSVDNAHRSAS
ncbi:MAG: integrase core domain-containing protein [Burkholderiaceae bacterium]|nr:integrase core domain-containing protein [Burkholderiaceae bacterium]